MKDYGYFIDLPHSSERVWRIMQDYGKWAEFAGPMVLGVDVAERGDGNGNGLVRVVKYRLPLGFRGESVETISELQPGIGYTYTSRKGTIGKLRLEKLGENQTRLHFQELLKMNPPFSWFESSLAGFMEKYNRKTMVNMSRWLDSHPEYR
ncbi:MAG TPA: SRPBCC family protein [Dehalococcoidales bacterium]|nr:SRPBCC family protein [Dehalococcoidales bacterium]